jgi:hypothetical protein
MLCREEGEGSGGACAVPAAAGQFVHVGPTVRKKEERAKLTGMATFFPIEIGTFYIQGGSDLSGIL